MEHAPLEVLHKPKGEAEFDVVFVHGFGRHWTQTWNKDIHETPKTRRTDLGPAVKDIKDQSWITSHLQKELPTVRLATWGCPVIEHQGLRYDRVKRLAEDLSQELLGFRQKAPERPILFIAHSLGGTVLKAAILQEESKLLQFIDGIVFLGTPRFDAADQWSVFESAVISLQATTEQIHSSAVNLQADSGVSISQTFDPRSGSDDLNPTSRLRDKPKLFKLVKLDAKFEKALHDRPITICCIYETLPTGPDGIILVPKDRIKVRHERVRVRPGHGTHFSMTRIDPRPGTVYDLLVNTLCAMAGISRKPPAVEPTTTTYKVKDIRMEDGRVEVLNELKKQKEQPWLYQSLSYALELQDDGQLKEAEAAFREAIKQMSEYDPWGTCVVFARDKLTTVLIDLAMYAEARKELDGCEDPKLDGLEKIKLEIHANDHRSILRTARNRSLLLRIEGKFESAYSTLAEKLEAATDILPTTFDHLATRDIMTKILRSKEDNKTAETFLRELIEVACSLFGEKAPYTLSRTSELATLLWVNGQPHAAVKVAKTAYEGLETSLGRQHPAVLRAARRYANILRYRGQLTDASRILHAISPRVQYQLGEHHPAALWTDCSIASVYILQGRISEGAVLIQNTMASQIQILPPGHRDIQWSKEALRLLEMYQDSETKQLQDIIHPDDLDDELRKFLTQPSQSTKDQSVPHKKDGRSRVTFIDQVSPNSELQKTISVADSSKTDVTEQFKMRRKSLGYQSEGSYWGTPLHEASYWGDLDMVQKLLDSKLFPGYTTWLTESRSWRECGFFVTPLKAASYRHATFCASAQKSPLESASATMCSHLLVIQALLRYSLTPHRAGMLTDVSSPFLSCLELAVLFQNNELVELFVTKDDLQRSSRCFGNSLTVAASMGNFRIVQVLLSHEIPLETAGTLTSPPVEEAALALEDIVTVQSIPREWPAAWVLPAPDKRRGEVLRVVNRLLAAYNTSNVHDKEAKLKTVHVILGRYIDGVKSGDSSTDIMQPDELICLPRRSQTERIESKAQREEQQQPTDRTLGRTGSFNWLKQVSRTETWPKVKRKIGGFRNLPSMTVVLLRLNVPVKDNRVRKSQGQSARTLEPVAESSTI